MTLSAFEDGLIHFVLTNKLADARRAMDEFLESKGASLGHSELLRRELSTLENRVKALEADLAELDWLAAANPPKNVKLQGSQKPHQAATAARSHAMVARRQLVYAALDVMDLTRGDSDLARQLVTRFTNHPSRYGFSRPPGFSTIRRDIAEYRKSQTH
jgi:hypothetical protein